MKRSALLVCASVALGVASRPFVVLSAVEAQAATPAPKRVGTLGIILPTHTPAFLNDLSSFLPPGVAIMPVYLNMTQGSRQEFESAMPAYEKGVEFLAGQGCDLVSAGGAPPFMMAGYARESTIVSGWQKKYSPVIAQGWDIQKRLHQRWPVPGYGRLIAELP